MKNSPNSFDIIIVLLGAGGIAAAMILALTNMISQSTAVTAAAICAIVMIGLLALKNYKHSAYGGKFARNYPDSSLNK
jgi:uncharacterized membrane protein YebE (DUF533 family)